MLFIKSKSCNAVCHFSLFYEPSKTKFTVTYVTDFCVESFRNHCSVIRTFLKIFQNCIIFSKFTVKHSFQNNFLKDHKVFLQGIYFCLFFIDIWWNSDCTRVTKDVIISEGNFIYTKTSKHLNWYPFCLWIKTLLK